MHWRLLLGLSLLGLVPLGGRADLVITQEVESAGGKGSIVVSIKGRDLRADLTGAVSMIFDATTGDTIWLRPTSKTFSRVTAEESKQLAARVLAALAPGTKGKLQPTAQVAQIGEYRTTLVLWTIGELKFRFWVTPSSPATTALESVMEQMQNTGTFQAATVFLPTRAQLPGLRVRTEMESQGQTTTYTLTSAKDQPVSPLLFNIPDGYRETPFSATPAP